MLGRVGKGLKDVYVQLKWKHWWQLGEIFPMYFMLLSKSVSCALAFCAKEQTSCDQAGIVVN